MSCRPESSGSNGLGPAWVDNELFERSRSDHQLRSARRPVMAVHPESLSAFSGDMGEPESVLVPLDGSERSESAVDIALEIAKSVDAELVLFRVVQYPYYGITAIDATYHNADYGVSAQRREAEQYLEQFKERAERMGLDMSRDRTLWRDKAMIMLNKAVLLSFERTGMKMANHHEAAHEFLDFCRVEQNMGREPYGRWMWLVPPTFSSATPLYQEPFRDVSIKPAFHYQRAAWEA